MGNKFGSRLLGELCHEITVGFVGPMTNEYIDNGIPFLRSKNIDEYDVKWDDMKYISLEFHKKLSKSALKPGDVAIVRTGKPGTTCVIPNNLEEANCSDIIIVRVNNELLCPHYLSYFMNAMAHGQVNAHVVGAVQQHFNVGSAKKLEIPLPNRAIQANIVHVLKTLDDKVKLNRQINQTLEQMAQALFKSWFVDYDPVVDNALDAGFFEQDLEFSDELLRRAEARRNVRESDNYIPLPEAVRQKFPAAFELCSEPSLGLRGWVPQGWAVTTVGDVFIVKGGSTPSTANPDFWEKGDIHWTSPKDLSGSNDKILLTTERKITSAGLQKITSGLLPKETVLMSSRAPVGYLALTKIPTAINQGYIAITDTKGLSPEFTLYWLDSNMDKIKSMSGGTTFAEISKKTFRGIQLVAPSFEIVSFFSTNVGSYLSKITKNSEECSTLEDLREYLLPKLINGELRVNS
ncbi:restriction endonuclease subunit S [Raoultella ornithinolytica]|uniref:restriction endonuclease subunit S n=1 Tax=Raoultella ornithinolytica TaxID=54291 RepID=UPI001E477C7F|nr:restriction endonuclease subunit S [Raoultella ornithinolytica]MCC2036743.1 restriction endonuclease subunit S [Raoultella ornithinolytica]MCC2041034.1 restriction endonuclease subunit S [Raoultella ornithinolytica]MCC2046009.1 restriction endonuclease subunit S [Raoultella ornithinolytica]MCC2051596.1 restriction endonuclease subunit S [Raoultella ornithinolytica]MCC2057379.1 restriction endonuclease subunit S [Raoultella ornithinolytica]